MAISPLSGAATGRPLSGMVAYTGEICLSALLRPVSLLPALYAGFVAGNRLRVLPVDHSYPLGRRRPMVTCDITLKLRNFTFPQSHSELRLEIRLRIAVSDLSIAIG